MIQIHQLEQDRHVSCSKLQLQYRINGRMPVQAEGHIQSYRLYFHSGESNWIFAVSLDERIDPAAICGQSGQVNGFFVDAGREGFEISGDYEEASFMPFDVADEIIKQCARRFSLASRLLRLHQVLDQRGEKGADWLRARNLEGCIKANQPSNEEIDQAEELLTKYSY